MDFIDWCHHVLQTLENERFNSHLSDHELQNILFGETALQSEFHGSQARLGMFDAIKTLSEVGFVEEGQYRLKITPLGRKVLANPSEYWTEVCEQEIDLEEQTVLNLVNQLSPKYGSNPDHAWLKDVEAKDILQAFEIPLPPMQSNEHGKELIRFSVRNRALRKRIFLPSSPTN